MNQPTPQNALDLSKDEGLAIRNLFRKYEKQHQAEFDDDNWIKFHYGSEGKGGINAVKESLRLIGCGEITDKGNDSFMYKELFKDDSLILVVHASLKASPYGGAKGYKYSFGIYRNNPRTQQIGGGYGTSGIVKIVHTKLLSYDDYDLVHYNRILISKVCDDIKKYALNNF